jgi:prophage endopeptidase
MSLFNPWVLLGIILFVTSSFLGGYYKGSEDEALKQQAEIAKLNEESRQKEQALVSAVNKTATQLVKVNNEAKIQIAKRDAAIASGTLRLRIPVKAPDCPVSTSTDTPSSSRDSIQTTTELDPTIARSLVAITDKGDENTRQLNACIDAYNSVYQTLKGKP